MEEEDLADDIGNQLDNTIDQDMTSEMSFDGFEEDGSDNEQIQKLKQPTIKSRLPKAKKQVLVRENGRLKVQSDGD